MPKLDEKIAAAELKVKQLKTRQRQLEARKRSRAAKNQRSQELRRKILIGATVLARVDRDEIDHADLQAWLDAYLTREEDRALFDLPAKTAPAPA